MQAGEEWHQDFVDLYVKKYCYSRDIPAIFVSGFIFKFIQQLIQYQQKQDRMKISISYTIKTGTRG